MRGWKLLVVLCAGNAPLPHPCRPLAAPVPHGMHLDSSLCGGVGEWRLRIARVFSGTLPWMVVRRAGTHRHTPGARRRARRGSPRAVNHESIGEAATGKRSIGVRRKAGPLFNFLTWFVYLDEHMCTATVFGLLPKKAGPVFRCCARRGLALQSLPRREQPSGAWTKQAAQYHARSNDYCGRQRPFWRHRQRQPELLRRRHQW